MVRRCEGLIEADNVLFKNRKIFPKFVLAPLCGFLNSKLDRLSRNGFNWVSDDHNFFELGYCVHTQCPHSKIFLDQASALIILQFQEETTRVLKHLLGQEKYLSEGTECDHNIQIQINCDHQDTQWNPFHTQAVAEIICPILNPGIGAMELIQI